MESDARRATTRTTPHTAPRGKPAPAALTAADQADIERFLEQLWAEDGLADRTLAAYRNDLGSFARWLAPQGIALGEAGREAILRYLGERGARGLKARSNARLISTLRRFHAARLKASGGGEDPTALLDSPKLPRGLPKALGEREIESLLAAPDIATPLGLRDRTLLELMYACGLRVSELVNLPLAALNLRQGVLRIDGKGGRERLVPIGELAMDWLERYLREARPLLAGARRSRGAAAHAPRQRHDPADGVDADQAPRAQGRHPRATHLAARAAPRLRHAPAQPRRRPARRADAARPRQPVDHADLHPGRARGPQAPARTASSARVMRDRPGNAAGSRLDAAHRPE
ncbi:site-specific tyrosine recombinase XerD [mine drainage metagenome]|uniref:Site-specific tyrosine recombinase XerD n=1 Tax=mine drainage metagenome TaxID=410659 RepID=T1CX69_9ZZZZ